MSESFLDEATIFFTERCFRGEGLCRFMVPGGARSATLDRYSYFLTLPKGKTQVCLRIRFELDEDECVRIRYDFPIDPINIYSYRFLKECFDKTILVPIPDIPDSSTMDMVGEKWRPAWMAATEGLTIRRRMGEIGVPSVPVWSQLQNGWERTSGYGLLVAEYGWDKFFGETD